LRLFISQLQIYISDTVAVACYKVLQDITCNSEKKVKILSLFLALQVCISQF